MNEQQMKYAVAKAGYEAACQTAREVEQDFCKRYNLRNPDGSPVTNLCSWEASDEKWNAMVILAAQEGGQKACESKEAARLILVDAENTLIEYALSVVPACVRVQLQKGVKEHLKIREQVIDMAFRLDTSTVPPATR